ncbi:hypothetical protein [Fuerstiella marisgermanici]|uniref:Uncharacterized protein n=1 Tax=Fuerstiella marisgermanici TaxID=1891926 RepID=A0A1P8WHJ4_9PLAN|nr:hypothetical protein [Fuerstiella marisgermanici]APZ93530.1 hypothetical protein Fuma_03148 [Fuerstiella marisgermanici]
MSDIEPSTTHRHDNRTELEKLLIKSKPWFEQNGTLLIYGVAAILAVAAVVVYMKRAPAGDVEASRDLLTAVTPEDYRDLADAHPDSTIAVWARLRQAERLLDNGVGNMFTNREVGVEELDQAKAAFERLESRTDIDDQVRERVLAGLARLAEATCDGEAKSVKAAVAAWQKVLDDYPESLIKEHAEDRIAALESPEAKTFYAWFSKQNPKPVDPGATPNQSPVPTIPELPVPDFSNVTPEGDTPKEDANKDSKEDSDAAPAKTESEDKPATPAADEKAKPGEAKPEPKAADAPAAESKPDAEPKADAKEESAPETEPQEKSEAGAEEAADSKPEAAAEGEAKAEPKPEGDAK